MREGKALSRRSMPFAASFPRFGVGLVGLCGCAAYHLGWEGEVNRAEGRR